MVESAARQSRHCPMHTPRHPLQKSVCLVAAATAAAAGVTAAGARKAAGGLDTVAGGGGKNRKLDGSLLARAMRARDGFVFVDDDLFELGFAVFADVFVDRHRLFFPHSAGHKL
jgi:hypothetical protein